MPLGLELERDMGGWCVAGEWSDISTDDMARRVRKCVLGDAEDFEGRDGAVRAKGL